MLTLQGPLVGGSCENEGLALFARSMLELLEVPVLASGVITGGDAVDAAIGDGPLSVGDAALFCGCVWRVGVYSDPGYARK
jgi:hypothetical protein